MFGKYTMYTYRQHFEPTLQAKQLIQGSQVGAWVTKRTGIHMYIYMCVQIICLPAHRSIFRYMGSIVKTKKRVNMKEKQAYMYMASSDFTAVWEMAMVSLQYSFGIAGDSSKALSISTNLGVGVKGWLVGASEVKEVLKYFEHKKNLQCVRRIWEPA